MSRPLYHSVARALNWVLVRSGFLLGVFMLVFVGCSTSKPNLSPTMRPRWVGFTNMDGGFSVMMPGKPKEAVDRSETDAAEGVPVWIHKFIVNPDAGREFGVLYNDFPEILPYVNATAIFDAGQKALLSKWGESRLVYEGVGAFQNNAARELAFEATEKGWLFRWKMILAERRLYQVGVISQLGKDIPADTELFLKSFRLEKRQ